MRSDPVLAPPGQGSIRAVVGKGGPLRARSTPLLVGILLLCLVVSLLVGCSGSAPEVEGAQTSDRPNIVFVLADDMRADDFEYMPQTRQLLAEEGLAFDNAFVTHSLCCPSRASILRGQYTHNHQVWTNNPPDGGFSEFRSMGHEDSTLATWLKDEGYQTALIGKYLNGYARRDEEIYVPPGWDEWYGVLGGDGYYDYQLNENGEVFSYGGDEQDYQTDVLADKARDYVRRVANFASPSPFFLYLAPGAPHGPFVPAPRHEGAYGEDGAGVGAPRPPSFYESDVGDKPEWVRDLPLLESVEETASAGEEAAEEESAGSDEESPVGTEEMIDSAYRNRLEMLLSLDEMVAGLVDELRVAGELNNTYVLFTSDNGYHFGEHRINRGKRTVYEETVRVPLAVRGPGVPAGEDAEQMALNIDLAPTIAELTGASTPEFVDGRSLAPFLRGAPPEIWRSAFLIQHYSGGNAQHRSAPTYAAVRTETHKYVEHENGDRELYDLEAEPYELESLHESADPTLITDLKARLGALRACASEACREAENAP